MNHLDVLVQHRDNLLLAEAVGWLHDYRKCSDEHLKAQAPNGKPGLSRSALKDEYPCIDKVKLPLFTPTVAHLLNDKIRDNDSIGRYLSRCHKTAHFDKQEPVGGEQEYPGTKLSTPFGFEKDIPTKLTEALWALPWNDLCNYNLLVRENLRKEISNLFSKAVADTRRPINEVDLWSWGLLVGALYKAALAGALLTGSKPKPKDLHWRLLGVRVDGLGYLLNVVRIPDLLARKELLTDGLNKVRELLEVTYPLGSEVYRDENGSIFVVPDVSDLLQRTESGGLDLETLILQAFARGAVKNKSNLQLDKEIMPHLELESQPWWGQDPKWPESHKDKLPDIIGLLTRKITSAADAERVGKYWQGGQVTDICTVCGLRPQGPGKKAADRNVCDICEERRADRSQQWVTSQMDRTIWTDEVADANGRLALILGQFDLMHWLDGSMLQTLLLIAPKNNEGKEPGSKAPSFSRLRRIWETTRTFWEEVQTESLECLKDDRRQLKIYFKGALNLAPYHVYDLVIGPTDLSVVWVPSQDSQPGYLLSADNLGYIARQLGAEPDTYTQPAKAAAFVEDYLVARFVKNAQQPILLNPDTSAAWESINLTKGTFIDKVVHQDDCYATFIPILAEPRSFMALVPADKALHIVKYIKGKYESEMGKVRNRLPLHLGCVYASRRTPIRAVLDAGRAMLDHRARPEKRVVIVENREENELTLTLERNGHRIQWHIPLKMGDGKTEDSWYPYFFLDTEGDDSEVGENNRRTLKVSCPTEEGQMRDCQIVHAADLRTGETTYIWPSTFDFEYLDTTARRFDIYYDEDGRRPRRTRPFYLEDLGRLEELWGYMKRLTKTQRQQVIRTIEATRETWYGQDQQGRSVEDDVFKQFVTDTLAGAAWPEGQPWGKIPEEWRDKLIQAGVCGELTDLAELHMKILKE